MILPASSTSSSSSTGQGNITRYSPTLYLLSKTSKLVREHQKTKHGDEHGAIYLPSSYHEFLNGIKDSL
eukprot:943344-Amphidinium_carterae.1